MKVITRDNMVDMIHEDLPEYEKDDIRKIIGIVCDFIKENIESPNGGRIFLNGLGSFRIFDKYLIKRLYNNIGILEVLVNKYRIRNKDNPSISNKMEIYEVAKNYVEHEKFIKEYYLEKYKELFDRYSKVQALLR